MEWYAGIVYFQKICEAGEVPFTDGKTVLYIRAVDRRPTLWNKLSALWS